MITVKVIITALGLVLFFVLKKMLNLLYDDLYIKSYAYMISRISYHMMISYDDTIIRSDDHMII